MLDPRNLTFVAVSTSNPSVPVGYTQFLRIGDDEGAKRQIASRKSFLLTLAAWMYWVYCLVERLVVGKDKSSDPERQREFEAETGGMEDEYWGEEGRRNRWYTQSCVVKEQWQGKGIGKKLMAEVIARAEGENVVVGLEASLLGELLYRSMGFELLGRFKKGFGDEKIEDAGGVMMYTPIKRRGLKS
jgi:GNAT superfamily N-acetyltransferase